MELVALFDKFDKKGNDENCEKCVRQNAGHY
jgi:hypothetical protein